MSTLLVRNERAALIGGADGSVRTELLPLVGYYGQPAHANKNDEHYITSRAGGVSDTDISSVHFLHTNEEKFPFQTYGDEANDLSVRAAFDPQTGLWVVADLDSDENPENAPISEDAI